MRFRREGGFICLEEDRADALEQALHARRPIVGGLVHHSDRGVQYVSITVCPEHTESDGGVELCER